MGSVLDALSGYKSLTSATQSFPEISPNVKDPKPSIILLQSNVLFLMSLKVTGRMPQGFLSAHGNWPRALGAGPHLPQGGDHLAVAAVEEDPTRGHHLPGLRAEEPHRSRIHLGKTRVLQNTWTCNTWTCDRGADGQNPFRIRWVMNQ